MSLSLGLMAQTKGKKKITSVGPSTTLPLKEGDIKGQQDLNDQYKADFALSKCDRYMRFHKRLWQTLLNSNPTVNNPLELSKEISRLRFLPGTNATGHIVFEKINGAIKLPPLTSFSNSFSQGPYPFPMTGTTVLVNGQNNNITTVGFHWETGNYGTIKKVEDIYIIGGQHFIDVINIAGINYTIKILPYYEFDGCTVPTR